MLPSYYEIVQKHQVYNRFDKVSCCFSHLHVNVFNCLVSKVPFHFIVQLGTHNVHHDVRYVACMMLN